MAFAAGVCAVVAVALVEFVNYRASRVPPPADRTRAGAVIVLGFPTKRNGQPNTIQRWRTRIAVRTANTMRDPTLVFTGAATRQAASSEAAVMAHYAVTRLGFPADRIALEERATSTWENVRYGVPIATAGGPTQIAIASDPLHADKARRYLAQQFPRLDATIVRAQDYRFLERWWLKVLTTANYVRLRLRGGYGAPPITES